MTTQTAISGRPQASEYDSYWERYISLVSGEDILPVLEQQRRDTLLLLSGRSEEDGQLRYAAGKWSVKELIGHICDSERILAYRALRIARADATPIDGFEQDDYVRNAPFNRCLLSDLIEDFIAVRRATISLLRTFDEQAWLRRGTANQKQTTVRAIAYVIAGHELHHRRVLEAKYFTATPSKSGDGGE
jgi:uncharacterized damage-inducible protein DinB